MLWIITLDIKYNTMHNAMQWHVIYCTELQTTRRIQSVLVTIIARIDQDPAIQYDRDLIISSRDVLCPSLKTRFEIRVQRS